MNKAKLVNLDAARQKAIEPVVLVCRKKGSDRQGKQCKKKSLVCSAVGMGSVCAVWIYSEMAKYIGVQGRPKVEVEKSVHVQSIV